MTQTYTHNTVISAYNTYCICIPNTINTTLKVHNTIFVIGFGFFINAGCESEGAGVELE